MVVIIQNNVVEGISAVRITCKIDMNMHPYMLFHFPEISISYIIHYNENNNLLIHKPCSDIYLLTVFAIRWLPMKVTIKAFIIYNLQ